MSSPLSELNDQGWRAKAACADMDPNEMDVVFFPPFNDHAIEAKRVCIDCPVMDACLSEALANREEFGVWGCMTERERKALLRRRWKQANRAAKLEAAS